MILTCFSFSSTHPLSCNPVFTSMREVNITCAAFSLVDLIISLIAYGIRGENSYFRRSHFNKINVVIVIVEMMFFTPVAFIYTFYRYEKIRVLRMFFFLEYQFHKDFSMRIMIISLFRLIPKTIKYIIIWLMTFYFFALILNCLYRDDDYYCDNITVDEVIETKYDCLNWGGDWVKRTLNFSNPFSSLLYLYLVATMEGWMVLMQNAMNLNGVDRAPSYNSNEHIQIFFVFFFFFGNLIVLNFFISYTLFLYKKIKENETGEWRITENEKSWLSIKLQILALNPIPHEKEPTGTFRKYIYRFCHHKAYTAIKFTAFIALTVGTCFLQSGLKNLSAWFGFWGTLAGIMAL